MIFVTVGTHEQPFDRLVRKIDELVENNVIQEEVVIQTGYSTYEPSRCVWQKFFPFDEMWEKVHDARIVITHGGPSSFIMPLQEGKVPIVVPRRSAFNEHVNDHQVAFCHAVEERQKNLIVVDDIEELGNIISRYDELKDKMANGMEMHNAEFCRNFGQIVDELVKGG